MGRETIEEGRISKKSYDEWLAEYIRVRKAYSDIVFTAFEMLNFHTQMSYTELGEMPYNDLITMMEEFKPRLKEIGEAKQAGKLAGLLG